MRRAEADHAADLNQRGPVGRLLEAVDRAAQAVQVVDVVQLDHVPAVAGEPRGHVFAERQRRVALDRDVVVVVDPAEVRELQVSGQRGRLAADAFHQVAVAAQGVDVEVEQLEAGPVVVGGQPAGGDRHAHAVADALAQRAGGGFHAAGVPVLGMARAAAVQLAELADGVQRHGRLVGRPAVVVQLLHAGQVQHGVEQHRGVAAGEHEPVAVGPGGLGRVVAEHLVPQHVGHRGQGHRRARMPAVGRLDGVHREGADGVDCQLFDGFCGHGLPLKSEEWESVKTVKCIGGAPIRQRGSLPAGHSKARRLAGMFAGCHAHDCRGHVLAA